MKVEATWRGEGRLELLVTGVSPTEADRLLDSIGASVTEDAVWATDESMRLLQSGDERLCRMKGCRRKAIVELARTSWNQHKVYWWAYCDRHMYGRVVHGSRCWIKVWGESPIAERAEFTLPLSALSEGSRDA